ncbi:MAG: hydantoinase/oxoprolinase family protein [Lysobacterales bacterium]|jgi:N-methylhydantoinase A/oxoprolinase/acetone carboxylase beta subunit
MGTAHLKLGIDTGGTYTDAVLADRDSRIVASAKSLTTRHDLTLGIDAVLDGLPAGLLDGVELVALSTTLSTNAVVEGRGAPVAVLLPGYGREQVERSGLLKIFDADLVNTLPGGHDAAGAEVEPLDEARAGEIVQRLAGRVSAFAVSAMFGVRNPIHEQRLRDLVRDTCARPVTCGHELASDLDAPRRALTAALNARMVPVIQELIEAVRGILGRRGIKAPLMIVKGNGSLVNTEAALRQPVGTVLSGPAASVVGACALSGARNAIVADMGGTTTDIAVVREGQAELCTDGVLIGDWKPMVEAVRVISIGLGGDSEVRFSGRTGIEIGPRRVIPMSLLAHLHPGIRSQIEAQLQSQPGRAHNRFALPLERNEVLLDGCSGAELDAWQHVCEGPVNMETLAEADRGTARAVARLQRKGLVIYSGFAPSDAAHVLGLSNHWCGESARLAALVWARQMRHVYGLGRWQEGDAETPSRHVFERVSQRISRALIEAGLHQHRLLGEAQAESLTRLLAHLVFESSNAPGSRLASGSLFHLKFAADYPLVAVGAPAPVFFPDAAAHLGVDLRLPEGAEVANAFGAVMGSVVQRAQVTVTQPRNGVFIVHSDLGPQTCGHLDEALREAQRLAKEQARDLATQAGAAEAEVSLHEESNHVRHDVDGDLFLETRVIATATGRPALGR